LSGVVVDANGAPVPYAFIDLDPAEAGLINEGQQERADEHGAWTVHHLTPGKYHVSAQVDGLGVAIVDVTSPARDVRIALGGTTQLSGTVLGPSQATSFTFIPGTCEIGGHHLSLPYTPRVVRVVGGKFTIDEPVPACTLTFHVVLGGNQYPQTHALSPGASTFAIDPDHDVREALAEDGLPSAAPIGNGVELDNFDGNDEGDGSEASEASEGNGDDDRG
jgi:hypothetical protein